MTTPALAKQGRDGRRHYHNPFAETLPADYRYPSITTVIKQGVPKYLDNWIARVTAQFGYVNLEHWAKLAADSGDPDQALQWLAGSRSRVASDSSQVGDEAHRYFEVRALGHDPDDQTLAHTAAGEYAEVVDAWFEAWRPVVHRAELTVFSETHGYAGTIDLFAWLPGFGDRIGDVKTTQSGIWPEIGLQLAAARYADYGVIPGDGPDSRDGFVKVPIPEVVGGVGIHLRPPDRRKPHEVQERTVGVNGRNYVLPAWVEEVNHKTGVHTYPVECGPDVFRAFLAAMEVSEFSNRTKRKIVGAEIQPPELIPTGPGTDRLSHLRYRVAQLLKAHPEAGPVLAGQWPQGLVPFGKAEQHRHTYNVAELDAIDLAVRWVEGSVGADFVPPPLPGETPEGLQLDLDEDEPEPPHDEFVPASAEQRERLENFWEQLPDDLQGSVHLSCKAVGIPHMSRMSSAQIERATDVAARAVEILDERLDRIEDACDGLTPEEVSSLMAVSGITVEGGYKPTQVHVVWMTSLSDALRSGWIAFGAPPEVAEQMREARTTKLVDLFGSKDAVRVAGREIANEHGLEMASYSAAAVAKHPVLFSLTLYGASLVQPPNPNPNTNESDSK